MKSIADSETLWARFVPFDKHSLYPAKSRYTTIFLVGTSLYSKMNEFLLIENSLLLAKGNGKI